MSLVETKNPVHVSKSMLETQKRDAGNNDEVKEIFVKVQQR